MDAKTIRLVIEGKTWAHVKCLMTAFVLAGLASCAPSKAMLKQKYDEGYNAAAKECIADHVAILRELGEKNERLRKFNQLDGKGALRKANPCFDNPNDPKCQEKVTGKESWQK